MLYQLSYLGIPGGRKAGRAAVYSQAEGPVHPASPLAPRGAPGFAERPAEPGQSARSSLKHSEIDDLFRVFGVGRRGRG